jgi:PAS domain S-box-containing protein
MQGDSHDAPTFLLLTNHGQVLLGIAEDRDTRIRDLATRIGITERATQSIINDLVDAGFVSRVRVGRRNTYTVNHDQPLHHPALRRRRVGSLLGGLVEWQSDAGPDPTTSHPPDARDGEDGMNRLIDHVARLLHAPASFLTLISGNTVTLTHAIGVPAELLGQVVPLAGSLSERVVAHDEPLIVSDATTDPRVADLKAVEDDWLRACACVLLRRADGSVLGTLSVADTAARNWTEHDVHMLTSIALAAASQLESDLISTHHRESALRYRALLDSLPETLILVFDRELRLQVASGAALRRNGYTPDDLIGRRLEDISKPDRAAIVRPHYQRGLAGERHEFQNTGPDGVVYHIDVIPLTNPNGVIHSVMAVGREYRAEIRTSLENWPHAATA